MTQHLLILGCGYVGTHLAKACLQQGMQVSATTRRSEQAQTLSELGLTSILAESPAYITSQQLQSVTHIIDSIPLTRESDSMFASQPLWLTDLMAKTPSLQWAGYLSTTGVYGDAQGAWVDEAFQCQPNSPRGKERLVAEQAWLKIFSNVEIFRLAGIYGPERNLISRLMQGDYKAVQWNPPHYSSRIHIDDIIAALLAAMRAPCKHRIVNIADDLPLPHADYVQALTQRIQAPQPIILSPKQAKKKLSPTLLSFFSDNKRISNKRLHRELIKHLKYPSFREGIDSLLT